MKKMWKNFWTLTKRQTAGFTLVELIVVIAILAILAGVGVPAYSGYVTKANKQADISLISEIEQALTLAGYNGTFDEEVSGYVILSADDAVQGVEAGSALEEALVAAFGTGYADVLKLKYDSWGNSGLLKCINPEFAMCIDMSSYSNRQDRLMADVETITNVVDLISNLDKSDDELETGVTTRQALIDMFSTVDADGNIQNSLLDATNDYYGLNLETPKDLYTWSNNKGTDLSNLMVFATANEMDNMINQGTELSAAANYVTTFSHFYAYAAQDDEFAKTLDDYLAFLNDPTSVELTNYQGAQMAAVEGYGTGAMWYRSLLDEAGKSEGYKAYHEDNLDGTEYEEGSQPQVDQIAFQIMMSTMGNPNEEQKDGIAGALTDANLFTDGLGGQMYTDFMDAVDAMVAMGVDAEIPSVPAGSIGIIYVLSDNSVAVMDTTPKA